MNSTARWKRRPEGSTWGDFGADDQLGRLNLLTPEKVKQGVAEVREGISFCLSLPLDYPGGNVLNPRRYPPVLRPTLRSGKPIMNYVLGKENPLATDVINDDAVILHLQYSTQWDSLAHVGQMFDADGDGTPEPVYYNGYRAGREIVGPSNPDDAGAIGSVPAKTTTRVEALGMEHMAEKCVQGRGVMIDLHAHVGRAHEVIGYDRLMRILDKDGVTVEPGDMVCLHTGFAQMILEMNRQPDRHALENSCASLDGRDSMLLQWITDSGLSVLVADNYAVEALPAVSHEGCCATLPLHEHCLFKLGVHLGELWHLTLLADWLRKHRRSRFLLTAPPLRLPGAVGSPATPIATV
ncbi:MAG TPA: cyclase family protein [Burkholderiales bacterium]|nr:cyclase family protein [Burkholderiales bacterium]